MEWASKTKERKKIISRKNKPMHVVFDIITV